MHSSIDLKLYAYFQRDNSLVTLFEPIFFFKLANKYYDYAQAQTDRELKSLLYEDSLKRSLSARYQSSILGDKITEKNSHLLSKKCLKHIVHRKFLYHIFVHFPAAYRLFRIMDDPTLLHWEKNVRNNDAKK